MTKSKQTDMSDKTTKNLPDLLMKNKSNLREMIPRWISVLLEHSMIGY